MISYSNFLYVIRPHRMQEPNSIGFVVASVRLEFIDLRPFRVYCQLASPPGNKSLIAGRKKLKWKTRFDRRSSFRRSLLAQQQTCKNCKAFENRTGNGGKRNKFFLLNPKISPSIRLYSTGGNCKFRWSNLLDRELSAAFAFIKRANASLTLISVLRASPLPYANTTTTNW
jgi:hypothetical protein